MNRLKGIRKAEVLIVKVLEGDGSKDEPFNLDVYYILNEKEKKMKLLCVDEGKGLEELDDGVV